jgi:alpha-D-ribose 1-methylphosphonate 5-triphosphate synthase subunit PhnG
MTEQADTDQRRRWLSILAAAPRVALRTAWDELDHPPELPLLRAPECGLVMARGRIGGSGPRFNLGEVTVTRCTVQGRDAVLGHGYVRGRDKAHAELVARFDALLQEPVWRDRLLRGVIEPLAEACAAREAALARKAAATRVEFFTMVRGDG